MTKKKDEMLERLGEIEKQLNWIINYLLIKDKPISPPPFVPPNIYERENTCSECGMNMSGIMGHVCHNTKCPYTPMVTS